LHQRPPRLPIIAHVAALACVAALVNYKLLPLLALLPFIVMLLRCARGLYAARVAATARRIGFGEIGYGVLTVLPVAAGRWLGC
jgi:hypothetical protein